MTTNHLCSFVQLLPLSLTGRDVRTTVILRHNRSSRPHHPLVCTTGPPSPPKAPPRRSQPSLTNEAPLSSSPSTSPPQSATSISAREAVLHVLRERARVRSQPGVRTDHHRIALCIEGGGMRGAVSAGMVAAIRHAGMSDAFDAVYGCSAGAVVGAYFVSGQVPHFGARIYYDVLCEPQVAGDFIEFAWFRNHPFIRALRSPFTPPEIRQRPPREVPTARRGKQYDADRPVLWLDRLIDGVMRRDAPLDWAAFAARYATQRLHPVATSLTSLRSHAFDDAGTSLDALLTRLRASACVPGIAGDAVPVGDDAFVDGLFFEPIPYASAVKHGATHVVVLRTKGWHVRLPRKPGVYEWLIATPWLRRVATRLVALSDSGWCERLVAYLKRGEHIRGYHKAVATLRRGMVERRQRSAGDDEGDDVEGSNAMILTVSPEEGNKTPGQLERKADVVFEGVRTGFAAGYDVFGGLGGVAPLTLEGGPAVEDGRAVAKSIFTDEEIVNVLRRHEVMRVWRKAVWARWRRMRRRRRVAAVRGLMLAAIGWVLGQRRERRLT